jgi:hypothetical protein
LICSDKLVGDKLAVYDKVEIKTRDQVIPFNDNIEASTTKEVFIRLKRHDDFQKSIDLAEKIIEEN